MIKRRSAYGFCGPMKMKVSQKIIQKIPIADVLVAVLSLAVIKMVHVFLNQNHKTKKMELMLQFFGKFIIYFILYKILSFVFI